MKDNGSTQYKKKGHYPQLLIFKVTWENNTHAKRINDNIYKMADAIGQISNPHKSCQQGAVRRLRQSLRVPEGAGAETSCLPAELQGR